MREFHIEKTLPSVDVDLQLISLLDNYIHSELEILTNNWEKASSNLSRISIIDHLGKETVESSGELRNASLSNTTFNISIEKLRENIETKEFISVEMVFDKKKYYSNIEIKCAGENCRVVTMGLHEGILNILQGYKNHNSLLFLPTSFEMLFFGVIVGMLAIAFIKVEAGKISITIPLVILTCLSILFFARVNFPYIHFVGKRNTAIRNAYMWLISGILGSIIFTYLFPILLDFF